jgi:putative transposase
MEDWHGGADQRGLQAGGCVDGGPGRAAHARASSPHVLRIARETGFGYGRILGELKKLGIGGVSRSTVVNILEQAGLPSGPQRGERTWDEFLKTHAKTLWA